jgi:hypothetical protein
MFIVNPHGGWSDQAQFEAMYPEGDYDKLGMHAILPGLAVTILVFSFASDFPTSKLKVNYRRQRRRLWDNAPGRRAHADVS